MLKALIYFFERLYLEIIIMPRPPKVAEALCSREGFLVSPGAHCRPGAFSDVLTLTVMTVVLVLFDTDLK
jgi:hypothetical protein